jgi:soluble lytic murein transglycosylase-like protein
LREILRKTQNTQYWRPEQFNLLVEIAMALRSDDIVAKTWAEMESRVRPAQRSDVLAEKVARYVESRRIRVKSSLIPVVESLAAVYPHSEASVWAFHKLQTLSADRASPYVYSLSLISRLAGNSNLDDGLKLFLIELTEGPVRTTGGQTKIFDHRERIDYLVQIRFWQEARRLVEEDFELYKDSQSSVGRLHLLNTLNELGQIQARQGDHEAAARTWSYYLQKFSGQIDWRPATENLAESLARLRVHSVAARMYESLAQSPAADPITKWHHFWNTYLAGDYRGALALLDRPGYVPLRDRGIDGGLDYWRARILEKLGSLAEAEALYRKILESYGDNFYSLMVQARKPILLQSQRSDGFVIKSIGEHLGAQANGFVALEEPLQIDLKRASVADFDLRVIAALKRWGQYSIARRLFRLQPTGVVRDNQSTWFDSFKLAMDLKDFSYGMKLPAFSESQLKNIPTSVLEIEDHMEKFSAEWKLLFPFAYRDVVELMSASAGIDPFLLLGIMRAESVYDTDARSVVGARGLMQIMPFTAIRIARLMNDGRFQLSDLHRPEVNIGYGAFYLKTLIDYYKGNQILAVAAYNGGPVSVDRWFKHYGNLDVDEFVETIPFRETRRYVKSVFKNFNHYKYVWQQSRALAALPKMPDQLGGGEIF